MGRRSRAGKAPVEAVSDLNHQAASDSRVKYQLNPRKGPGKRLLIETTDLTVNDALRPNLDHPLADLSDASREDALVRDFARILVAVARRKIQPDTDRGTP